MSYDDGPQGVTRRKALASIGATTSLGLAGCLGESSSSGQGETGDNQGNTTPNGQANSSGKTTWKIETSTESTAAYQLSQGMATVINKNSDRLQLDARPGEGSRGSMVKMDNGELDLAYSSRYNAYQMLNNKEPFDDFEHDIYQIWRFYDVNLNFVAPKSSGISSVTDLEGKKVTLGNAGGNPDILLKLHLEKAIDPDKVEFIPMSYGQMASALSEGRIDAAHDLRLNATYSSTWKEIYTLNDGIRLLTWPDSAVEKINDAPQLSGARRSAKELANMYKADPEEVSLGYGNHEKLYWADSIFHVYGLKSLDNELLKHMLTVLTDNMNSLSKYHALASYWKDEKFIAGRMDDELPNHPAAVEFYKSIGIDVGN